MRTSRLRMARSLPYDAQEVAPVLVRFNESVRVRLWGRQLHSFRKGEVHNVSMAIAAVLFAQRFAEPVAKPPVVPKTEVLAA